MTTLLDFAGPRPVPQQDPPPGRILCNDRACSNAYEVAIQYLADRPERIARIIPLLPAGKTAADIVLGETEFTRFRVRAVA